MLRIDGYYLYELGHKIHRVSEIEILPEDGQHLHTCRQTLGILYPALFTLDEFMVGSVYKLRTIEKAAREFQNALQEAIDDCSREGAEDEFPTTEIVFNLQERHREFESVLKAEFAAANLYLVLQKSAFDTNTLIALGERAFPVDLPGKTPLAVEDLRQAMRCIAFELPTAAAFHLHRANEIVLGYYWDEVSGGAARPKNQTLGSYLHHLEDKKFGENNVLSALRDIKDLYRNPTIHAEQTLTSVEDAIDLQGAIRAAIGAMIRTIQEVAQP